jgi:hypothetical protein
MWVLVVMEIQGDSRAASMARRSKKFEPPRRQARQGNTEWVVGLEAKRQGAEDAELAAKMEKYRPNAVAVGKTGRARAAAPRPIVASGVRSDRNAILAARTTFTRACSRIVATRSNKGSSAVVEGRRTTGFLGLLTVAGFFLAGMVGNAGSQSA